MVEFRDFTEDDTKELAKKVALKLRPRDILVLTGELGTGKTTFTKALIKELGINDEVTSPTFTYVITYENIEKALKVHHMDLYRLKSADDFYDSGLGEYLGEPGSISILEWGELVLDSLPENTIIIRFYYQSENERKFELKGISI